MKHIHLFEGTHRLLAIVLAVVLLIGVLPVIPIPASAVSDGSVSLPLLSDVTDKSLTYEVSPSASNNEADPVKAGYTVVTDGGIASVFEGVKFTQPGTYAYRVVPVIPLEGVPGLNYDSAVYDVRVSVDEGLVAEVSEELLTYHDAEGKTSVDAGLRTSVGLDGRPLRDGMFAFELKPVYFECDTTSPKPERALYAVTVTAPVVEDTSAVFVFTYSFAFPAGSDVEEEPEGEITLVSGESYTFEALPEGTAYRLMLSGPDGYTFDNSEWSGALDADLTVTSAATWTVAPEETLPDVTEPQETEPESAEPENADATEATEPIEQTEPTEQTEPETGDTAVIADMDADSLSIPKPETCPMPDGYREDEPFVVTNTASGLVSFGAVTYCVPGIYMYEIRQMNIPETPEEGWEYDESVIGVTVYVTCDGEGTLHASVAYTRDGEPVSEAAFENVSPALAENPPAVENSDMSVEELLSLDIDVAGAALEYDASLIAAPEDGGWSYDIYYVNEEDLHAVHLTDDFSLKYQMEFHASRVLDAKTVEIRIPMTLFTFRDGNPCNPTDIAVPLVENKDAEPIPVKSSLFNYYIEDGNLVFFNYADIPAGTVMAWQIVYSNIEAMTVPDMSAWTFSSTATVGEDSVTADALTGEVDTSVTLLSLTKHPYSVPGRNYGPGLYTESQVKGYISGEIPEQYAGDKFDDYHYVVWEVTASGRGSQPFDLWLKEAPDHGGQVVGYREYGLSGTEHIPFKLTGQDSALLSKYSSSIKSSVSGYVNIVAGNEQSAWNQRYFVVTAYPAGSVPAGTVIQNDLSLQIVPCDQKDEPQTVTQSATWSYQDYNWTYGGDTIGVEKRVLHHDPERNTSTWASETEHSGWLEVFKRSVNVGTDYTTDFHFTTEETNRSFNVTHVIDGDGIGKRVPGKSTRVVTVDDAVYCYPGGTDEKYLLTGYDYYFSSVVITQTDYGYDVWEDKYGQVETDEAVDQSAKIYAMFAETDANGTGANAWVHVKDIAWPAGSAESSVALSYTFSPEEIARKPYRVMVVHDTINYVTYCDITVDLHIRYDSKTMKEILSKHPDLSTIQFENISGVSAQSLDAGKPDDGIGTTSYFQGTLDTDATHYYHNSQADNGNYGETGLADFTTKLYGVLLQRDNASASGSVIDRDSGAAKVGKLTNDAVNERAEVVYNITAFEGYLAGSKQIAQALIDAGVEPPNRNQIAVYDLLPLGMNYDPSYSLIAGRLTDVEDEHYQTQPALWDTTGVSARLEEVTPNYNGSGRTLLKFLLTYAGDTAPYAICDERLFQGWGIQFRGYWEWEDVGKSDLTANVAAVMSVGQDKPFLTDSPDKDDGNATDAKFHVFGADIDKDGDKDESVLFSGAVVTEDVAVAGSAEVKKTVRADADRYSEFSQTAVVEPGKTYTYDISVSNLTQSEKDIVIFDRLENAAKSHTADEELEDNCWYGTFKGIVTAELDARDITYTVYYSTNRDAPLPTDGQNPSEVLTDANGWSKTVPGNLADVRAIAVSLDGYTLTAGESVSIQILMEAPQGSDGAVWAYNNAVYVSRSGATEDSPFRSVTGRSTKTRRGEPKTVEVVKEFANADQVPGTMKNHQFLFHVYDMKSGEKEPYTYHEYTLWEKKASGEWEKKSNGATDGEGALYLSAGQKVVFENVTDATRIVIEEANDPFWKPEVEQTDSEDAVTYTVKNKASSVLYVVKNTVGGKGDYSNDEFTFLLTVDGAPAANVPYWVVDHAYTDGRLPEKLGEGVTGQDGTFKVKAGQIVAVIGAADFNATYTVTETDPGQNWLADPNGATKTGTLKVGGVTETFTNYYKWKDLVLTKTVNYQDAADAAAVDFTFKLEALDGDLATPMVGKTWKTESGQQGVTGEGGVFTCKAAAEPVTIEGLEAGKTYRITEINIPEFYAAVNGGEAEVSLPLYTDSMSVALENNWLKRPLKVTKTLVYDYENPTEAQKAKAATFTMTVTCSPNGSDAQAPLKNAAYTVMENGAQVDTGMTNDSGQFTIKGGQTAVFKDAGVAGSAFTVTETPNGDYPQLNPLSGAPFRGVMTNDGGQATIINGVTGFLALRKEWISQDETGTRFLEAELSNGTNLAVEVTMYTVGAGNVKTVWPTRNVTVTTVLDDGTIGTDTWKANSPYTLKPGMLAVVKSADLTDVGTFEISESAYDQRHIEDWIEDGSVRHLLVSAQTGVFSGAIDTTPTATFVNSVREMKETSRIAKRLLDPAATVTNGANLVLQVERYTRGDWIPAENVEYVLGYGPAYDEEFASDRLMKTGADGHVTLVAKDNKMPWVIFPTDKVYAMDVVSPQEGDMRIRELFGESDAQWGMSVGVGGLNNDGHYTTDLEQWSETNRTGETVREAFVNVTTLEPVEIGKAVEHETDDEFSFTLKQITEIDGDAYDEGLTHRNYKTAIKKTVAGAGISYTVYDLETGELISNGTTDKLGRFSLKGNEYAKLELPANTLWTVSEDVLPGYTLVDLEEYLDRAERTQRSPRDSDRLGVLDSDLLLIGADVAYDQAAKGTVTLDPNGGAFTETPEGWTRGLDGRYYMENVDGSVTLPETEIERDGYKFDGWQVDGEEQIYQPGEDADVDGDVTFKAAWKSLVLKYAVSIYGIKQDTLQNGNKAALTFGPATGADYTDDSRQCDDPNCIHNLTWTEIIQKANEDPTVFQSCLENGCTKSVELTLSDALADPSFTPDMSGDGAGILYNSIKSKYRMWNGSDTGGCNDGGWPGSRIRATLNGADDYTADGENVNDGNGKIYYSSEERKGNALEDGYPLLTVSDALISAFPAELQAAIKPKAVISDTKYSDYSDDTYTFTTYDKLWLFSGREIRSGTQQNDIRDNESFEKGKPYTRAEQFGITSSDYAQLKTYNESGSSSSWWLRSLDRNGYYSACYVHYVGGWLRDDVYSTGVGLAPGFCVGECQ